MPALVPHLEGVEVAAPRAPGKVDAFYLRPDQAASRVRRPRVRAVTRTLSGAHALDALRACASSQRRRCSSRTTASGAR